MKKNMEICPSCSKALARDDERVVSAGKQWHKACFLAAQGGERTHTQNVARANVERCPGCKQELPHSADKIVVAGKEWHRDCYNQF